jgi:radical SAM protein (TIGR01212 family)
MNIYTANQYIKDTFGEKLYKLSLNAGTTCPNRDGTAGIGGCIFCSSLGSGDFSPKADMDIDQQIEQAKQLVASKFKGKHYIAYFQSFTNTYGDIDRLRDIYRKAAMRSDIAVISIATRPDCLGNQVIDMLRDIQRIKPVWVELGLQTIHEETAKLINRGYPLSVYDEAVKKLRDLGVHVIVHMILGLPGETQRDMIETAEYIGKSGAQGIKLQLLHVLKGTNLAEMYQNGECSVLSLEDYTECVVSCLKVLPPDMVIHRLTGDGPKKLLIAPLWSADKKKVMNTINAAVRQL